MGRAAMDEVRIDHVAERTSDLPVLRARLRCRRFSYASDPANADEFALGMVDA
jgi:hypothetical protein